MYNHYNSWVLYKYIVIQVERRLFHYFIEDIASYKMITLPDEIAANFYPNVYRF